MKMIKDGNFAPWFRIVIWASGIMITVGTYNFLAGKLLYAGMLFGLVILAAGTYSESANLFKLKPFDDSYKKAKASYREIKEKHKTEEPKK